MLLFEASKDVRSAIMDADVKYEGPIAINPSLTADGADVIWSLAADYFPDSEQIVDWCHACECLHQVGYSYTRRTPNV